METPRRALGAENASQVTAEDWCSILLSHYNVRAKESKFWVTEGIFGKFTMNPTFLWFYTGGLLSQSS